MATPQVTPPSPVARRARWGRLILLPTVIALGAAAIFVFHLDRYLTFDALAANRAWLQAQVANHLVAALAIFAALYIAVAALSLPGAAILSLAAGFLFGRIEGTAVAVISATIGGTLLFIVARTSLGEVFRERTLGALETLKEGFARDAFNYLLFLRLVPLFPFWLVNLVAAFLDVPLRTFVIATTIGIVPGAAVYVSVGTGLGSILDRGQKPDLRVILSPPILIPLLALAALSLVPIAYRRLRKS